MNDSSRRFIYQGDLISLHVDSIGYFGAPSQQEPIPERSDPTSHLRAIATPDDEQFPPDFNSRCSFVITGEKGTTRSMTTINYGSYIRLKHKATNCTVIALHQEDDFDSENCYNSVALRNSVSAVEEGASTWQVLTRYKLRNEGDPIESDDFIVLRNSMFKSKYLTSVPPSPHHTSMHNHLIGLRRDEAFFKLGWKIRVMLPHNTSKNQSQDTAHEDGEDVTGKVLLNREVKIEGGMFVRLAHLESNGHFVARYDDAHLMTANMAPLGRFCQQVFEDPCHQIGLFVRNQSVVTDPNSALSIWQILPVQLNKLGPVHNGDSIRFRHVMTGQYLCIRTVNEEKDSISIRTRSALKGNTVLKRVRSSSFAENRAPSPAPSSDGTNHGEDMHSSDWTVATTSSPDESTLFHILTSDSIGDNKEDVAAAGGSAINNQSDVFFLHEQTHFIFEEKKKKKPSKKSKRSGKAAARWEDYAADIHMRPSSFHDSSVAVLREVYNIQPVSDSEVADVLYITKYLPIIKSAIATVQHTKKMSELFLPLFRHLNVATYTLVNWVMNQNDSDHSLLMHPAMTFDSSQISEEGSDDESGENDNDHEKEMNALEKSFEKEYNVDNIRFEYQDLPASEDDDDIFDDDESANLSATSGLLDETKYSLSSLGPWIGRGISPFKKSSIVNPIHSSRSPTFLDFNTKRQNIVSDSRILDLLLFFTTLVFRLLKDQVLHVDGRAGFAGKHKQDELKEMYLVPSLLTGTCILVHDLVHAVVSENRRNSVRVLAVKGSLLDMMDQEILGWHPPIDSLLIALQSKKRGTVKMDFKFDPTMVLDEQNIHNLIKKTYELYMTNNESAVNLVKLLTTLCSPGHIPNPVFQSLIMKAIFSTEMETRDSEAVELVGTEMVSNLFHSLFFSTRKLNGTAWQVRFKTPFKLAAYYAADESITKSVVEEMKSLKTLISPKASSGRMELTEVCKFLTVLGLGGHSLHTESNFLEFADFDKLMDWYWTNRAHFFPSARTSLNEMTYAQVKARIELKCSTNMTQSDGKLPLSTFSKFSVLPFEENEDEEGLTGSESDDEYGEIDLASVDAVSHNKSSVFALLKRRPQTMVRSDTAQELDHQKKTGGVFSRLFHRKQQEAVDELSKNDHEGEYDVDEPRLSEVITDTPVHSQEHKPVFFWKGKKSSSQPPAELTVRETKRKGSKDQLLTLTPFEEFCEFREQLLAKLPAFDIGAYSEAFADGVEYVPSLTGPTNKPDDGNYGGIAKKGLSIFLLYSTEQAMSQMKKKLHGHKGRVLPWDGLFQVLGHSSFERDWLRQCIILMAELCRGENLQAQTLVNQLFPASMVLDMLGFGGENSDKLAVVTLLQNVYVVHDLVFPVVALCGGGGRGGSGSSIVCSLNEGDSSISFNDAGKVFNNMTRCMRGVNDGDHSSKMLRKMLWRNLSDEMNGIDLNSRDNEVLAYHTCLLTLLRELICRGFFEESSDFEAEIKKMKDRSKANNLQEKKSMFSRFKDITSGSLSFNEKDISRILIQKITAMVEGNKNGIDDVRHGVLKTLDNWKAINKISEGEHSNTRQKLLKNSNPVSIGSDNINLVNEYFAENFSNSVKILLVQEVISILDLIYDSRQLESIKEILSLLNHADQFFSPAVLRGEEPIANFPAKFYGVSSKIKQLFATPSGHAAQYTDAMLALTLFTSDKVKSCAYDLLYKTVSMKMNAYQVLNDVQIYVSPRKAASLRLFQQFQYIARKYAKQMMSESITNQFNYKMYISFAMEAIKSLCYHTHHEASSRSIANVARLNNISFVPGKLHDVPLLPDGQRTSADGIEMTATESFDFTLQPHKKYDAGTPSSLLGVTEKYIRHFNTAVEEQASDVCRDIILVFTRDINSLALARKGVIEWSSLNTNEQYFLNAMMDVCATICVNRPSLVIELLLKISTAAVSFMWESKGASRIVELYCEFCDITEHIDEHEFLQKLDELFVARSSSGSKPNASVIRLFDAIFSSGRDTKFVRHCYSFVDKHVLSDGSMREYILLNMAEPTKDDIEFHFQILRMFATIVSMSGKSTLQKIKACVTVDFCTQLLSSCCPLQIKMCVFTFCQKIYKAEEIPLLSFVAMDLKNILNSVETEISSSTTAPTPGSTSRANTGAAASAEASSSTATLANSRRFDSVLHPLMEYLSAVAAVVVDTASHAFSVDRDDLKICKTSIDEQIHDNSILSTLLLTKRVHILPYIEEKLVAVFQGGARFDSVLLKNIFECIVPLYNIMKSPAMSSFRDLLVSKVDCLENMFDMFTTGFLMTSALLKNKTSIEYTKEALLHQHSDVNPNAVVKGHMETMLLLLSSLQKEYEDGVCREQFLMLDGIDIFNRQVSRILVEDSTQEINKNSKKYVNMESFTFSLECSHDLSAKFIQQTILFQVLQRHLVHATAFMENGGRELIHGTLINETSTLKKMTDFDKWTMCGGLYFSGLGSYMQNYSQPTSVNFFLLHVLCELLENDIDEIRASNKTTKNKVKLMGKEVERLQRYQDTFENLGICDLVLAIVGRSLEDSIDDSFVLDFVPLALKVGFSLLASGNDSVQEALIRSYKSDYSSGAVGSHKKHFMESLRKILRGVILKIEMFTKLINDGKHSEGKYTFPVRLIKLLIKIYDFCGSLCSGHNDAAKNFLRDQDHVGEPIDLVFDIAKSVNSVLTLLVSQMRYITFDQFYEILAPPVWPYYPDVKRRFIKWHDQRVDFSFVCQILAMASSGFNSLTEITQGPCFKNQPSALCATPYCQELLEYVGAMQLRCKVNKKGSKSLFDSKTVVWDGRHPVAFNKTYKKELKALGRFRDDPDFGLIVKQLSSLNENSKGTKQFNAQHKLLTSMAQMAEQNCLRFLLALLEATSPLVSETLVTQLNDGILLQNMENQYKLSFESKGKLKEFRSEVTVSYLTLISIMASTMRDDPNALLDDFLLQWKQDNAAQGYNTEKLVASIEVTSQEGSVQRVYFAIPTFVTTYWAYPEVQKAKDKFLWAVSRESPEDKLSDFYERAEGLIQVMRRQEALRHMLTPLVHGIFGGVNFLVKKIFFLKYMKMQPIFLILSFCFNFANMYWQYREQYPWIVEEEYSFFRDLLDFEGRDQYIFYAYCIHFSLATALFIRAFLNSPAADNFQLIYIFGGNNPVDIVVNGVAKLSLTVLDSWWPICLMGFSAGGILINPYLFAPILLDLINQIRLMSFLLEAITRNLGRIAYTLLLAIVFLYLFAVITIVGFEDQYALAGKSACSDLISCFKLQIDYGLVNPPEWVGDGYIDPYISADAEASSYGHISSIIAGSVFNFSYIILINLVLQAIISGLIIDTFSEMRAESEEIEVDIREKCFICSIDRDEFEQLDIPFVEHVKNEHNMWQYIWFMIYLESKDPLSYTGPEQYLSDNLTDKNGFVRLGPIRKSLSIQLKAGNAKEKISLKTVMESIRENNSIQYDMRRKVDKTEKSLKENQKHLIAQKAKFTDMEKFLVTSSDHVKSYDRHVHNFEQDVMSKLGDVMHVLNKTKGSKKRDKMVPVESRSDAEDDL